MNNIANKLKTRHVVSKYDVTTGNIIMTGNLTGCQNMTTSNLTVNGTKTIINTQEIISSNLTVGNVGTGPALAVIQSETTSQPVAQFVAGTTQALYINSSGNVGIGNSTPASALQVTGTITATTFSGGASGLTGLAQSAFVDATNATNISAGTLAAARLPSIPTSSLTGTVASGNLPSSATVWNMNGSTPYVPFGTQVGIDTASPNYTLSINGNFETWGNHYIHSGGAIGVGTTNPQWPLVVQGQTLITGSVGIGTTAIGGQNLVVGGTTNFTGNVFTNSSSALTTLGYSGAAGVGLLNLIIPGFGSGTLSGLGAWTNNFQVISIGTSANSPALAMTYNNYLDTAAIYSLAPGTAWKPMSFLMMMNTLQARPNRTAVLAMLRRSPPTQRA